MAGYALEYVALVARDVDAVCRFMGDAIALPRSDLAYGDAAASVPVFAAGQAAVALFSTDHPGLDEPVFPGVHHMALRADDPMAAAARHGLAVVAQGIGLGGRPNARLDPAGTCGVRTRFIEPLGIAHPAPADEVSVDETGAIDRIDHLGVASLDNAGCIRVFADLLGCPVESTQTDLEVRNVTESFVSDKYGAVYHARPPEILGGLHGLFITLGDCELEIMMDFDPSLAPRENLGEEAGNTKGDQSAIAKFLARRGPGLAHLAFATRDLDGLLRRLGGDGWRLIDQVGRAGGRRSRIGFVHPANFGGGLLLHFVQPAAGPVLGRSAVLQTGEGTR